MGIVAPVVELELKLEKRLLDKIAHNMYKKTHKNETLQTMY